MTSVNFSALTPDYEGLRAKLAADLATRDSWRGLIETQTGTTLIDWIASIGAFAQASVLRAKADAFSETAVSSRALYSIADMQGLRLARKLPASITVQITYTQPSGGASTAVIPAYTQFQAGGTYWFTWDAISIPAGSTSAVQLHQGYVVDQTTSGLGTDFQAFESVEKDFLVSNAHVAVSVDGVPIPIVTNEGLWNYASRPGVVDRTTAEGRLHLLFGNATYGTVPSATSTVRIVYAVTSGADGNSVSTVDQRMVQLNNQVSGLSFVVTSNPAGGASQTPASTFKVLSSTNFGTMGSAVTKQQYMTVALSYPGVVDAKLFAQRERDTTNLAQMNVVQVSALTTSPWNAAQKTAFLAYMQDRTLYTTQLVWKDVTPAPRDLSMRLHCYNWANLTQCQADASAAIQKLFSVRAGYIGYDITVSDIHRAVLASNRGIEYIELFNPVADLKASDLGPPPPTVSLVNATSSALAKDTSYSYALGVQDAYGLRVPAGLTTAYTTALNQKVALAWDPYPGAVTYFVYGRTTTKMIQLAALPATTLTYEDDGVLTSGAPQPTTPVYPMLYNTVNTLEIDTVYSKRTTSY